MWDVLYFNKNLILLLFIVVASAFALLTLSSIVVDKPNGYVSVNSSFVDCGPIDVDFDSKLTNIDYVSLFEFAGSGCLDLEVEYSGCGPLDFDRDGYIGFSDIKNFEQKYYQSTCL